MLYDDFEECVSESDWVFESVAESVDIKTQIYNRISKCAKPNLIVTTGTSGFSINMLSKNFDEILQPRYFGTHFFNPPYSLTLCEVIRSEKTDSKLFDEMSEYLKSVLYRNVIETTDTPAFLGNRIGFQFMNKALQYAEKNKIKGGIDYIDAILGPFTGRGMTPIDTIDFVGLTMARVFMENSFADVEKKEYLQAQYDLIKSFENENFVDEAQKMYIEAQNELINVYNDASLE